MTAGPSALCTSSSRRRETPGPPTQERPHLPCRCRAEGQPPEPAAFGSLQNAACPQGRVEARSPSAGERLPEAHTTACPEPLPWSRRLPGSEASAPRWRPRSRDRRASLPGHHRTGHREGAAPEPAPETPMTGTGPCASPAGTHLGLEFGGLREPQCRRPHPSQHLGSGGRHVPRWQDPGAFRGLLPGALAAAPPTSRWGTASPRAGGPSGRGRDCVPRGPH